MEQFVELLKTLRDFIWGPPLLILLLGTGAYLTFVLRGVQFKYLGFAIRQTFAKSSETSVGDISQFQSLMTTLAGAIGTGTIVGVATAVAIGGLGSLFWMWITALLSMAIKYAEALLAVKYRKMDKRGEMIGGPMEYMEKGLGWKWLAVAFCSLAVFAVMGTGNLIQVNSISESIRILLPINPWMIGIVLSFFTGLVVLGGVKSIGKVASVLVPFMAIFYLIGGILILLINYDKIPSAFYTIFTSAFQGQAPIGGFIGSTMLTAMQMGAARSVLSNEAGLGVSSIPAAAARTDNPGRQAMINMAGTLISTVFVCTISGLVLAVTGVLGQTHESGKMLNGAAMAIEAFNSVLPYGNYIVVISLILFAFTTVLAWGYYGEKCFEYLFGEKYVILFRIIYTLVVIPGAALQMEFAWYFADIANAFMAIPNLIALIALSGVIASETQGFFKIVKQELISDGIA